MEVLPNSSFGGSEGFPNTLGHYTKHWNAQVIEDSCQPWELRWGTSIRRVALCGCDHVSYVDQGHWCPDRIIKMGWGTWFCGGLGTGKLSLMRHQQFPEPACYSARS